MVRPRPAVVQSETQNNHSNLAAEIQSTTQEAVQHLRPSSRSGDESGAREKLAALAARIHGTDQRTQKEQILSPGYSPVAGYWNRRPPVSKSMK